MIDLFGQEAPVPALTRGGKPKRMGTKSKGHAWLPGTGPEGETCRSCAHYVVRQWAGKYRKCGLMRDHWTQGPGTDIRAKDPACLKWQARPQT